MNLANMLTKCSFDIYFSFRKKIQFEMVGKRSRIIWIRIKNRMRKQPKCIIQLEFHFDFPFTQSFRTHQSKLAGKKLEHFQKKEVFRLFTGFCDFIKYKSFIFYAKGLLPCSGGSIKIRARNFRVKKGISFIWKIYLIPNEI